MKKTFSFFCMLLAFGLGAQAQQVFDLSTGVVDASGGTLIMPGSYDDTWEVYDPNGNLLTPKVCNPLTGTWAGTACSNWITTTTVAGNQPSTSVLTGDYYFITYVDLASDCDITSAYLNLNSIAGDNTVPEVYVNGYLHSTGIPNNSNNNYSAVSTGISINVTGELTAGPNEIIIYVNNVSSAVGLNLCGDLTVNTYTLSPAFNINNITCSGYVYATGYPSTGPGTSFSWAMDECDAGGILTFGGYTFSAGYSGTPGNYTFPVAACGKYYRIKLTTATSCKSEETSEVIFIPCPPSFDLGSNVTICYGTCTTIGLGSPMASSTYSWNSSAGAIAATTRQINVCPTSATTYSLTVTSSLTGCSTTDNITVDVLPNNPGFGVTTDVTNPSYYTIHALPAVTSFPGLTGFGYAWYVEELVSGSPIFTIANPSCWWVYTSPYATDFPGFDHTVYSYSGTATLASCTIPTLGKFLYNHTYRITRGTWSDQCSWQQTSTTLTTAKALSGQPYIYILENQDAPDMSGLLATGIQQTNADNAAQFSVYPNPGNGIFTIETGNSTSAVIEIYDALGKKVIATQQTGFKFAVDLTGFPKGIYMINIMSENKLTSKKIILE